MSEHDPVVITGVDVCCSLGVGRKVILEAMLAGGVEIDNATALERRKGERPCAAQVVEEDPPIGATRFRAEQLAGRVARGALAEAGLGITDEFRAEAIFGTTLGGLRHLGEALRTGDSKCFMRTTTATLNHEVLSGTGINLGATTVSAACASGLSAISLAATALLLDEADVVLAIGYDPISEFSYAGFSSLRLVSEGPLRPFTAGREGMRVGEGAAAFILERRSKATQRGATPLATLLGWGAASDAHHLTQPDPSGSGAARAIRAAMGSKNSGVPDVIFAHATSTLTNDAAEYEALRIAMGTSLPDLPVTALKSRIGHTLGAAGAVELAIAMAALERNVVPAVANATLDTESFPELNLVTEPRHGQFDRAAVISLGFGGADAAVLLEASDAVEEWSPQYPESRSEDLVITGVGVLIPEETTSPGNKEWHLDDALLEPLENARAVRRLSRLARLVRAAGTLASRSSGLKEQELADTSGFVATRFGAIGYTLDHYEELIRDGLSAGNPLYFAESVPNIGSAQLSLGLGLREMCLSIGGTRIAGIEALHIARRHILSGQSQRAIVVAADETHPRLQEELDRLGILGSGDSRTEIAEGAVALVLEHPEEAERRGAEVLGRMTGTHLEWPRCEGKAESMRTLRRCGAWAQARGAEVALPASSSPLAGLELRAIHQARGEGHFAPERHSVGPLLEIARWIQARNGGNIAVVAADESGGSGAIGLS